MESSPTWRETSASSVFSSTSSPGKTKRHRGRDVNVYDAVAGRVTLNGALGDSESPSGRSKRRLTSTAARYSSRNPKLAPEEVLFRRHDAPVRYAEHDIYWASDDLPDGGVGHLPEAGLLKSVHAYASKFYDAAAARLGPRCVVGTRIVDERSMDETALLAFGILLEEAGRHAVGERGDLVFTDAAAEAESGTKGSRGGSWPTMFSEDAGAVGEGAVSHAGREAKRRRGAKEESLEKSRLGSDVLAQPDNFVNPLE